MSPASSSASTYNDNNDSMQRSTSEKYQQVRDTKFDNTAPIGSNLVHILRVRQKNYSLETGLCGC